MGWADVRALNDRVGGARALLGQLFSRDSSLATVNCVACDLGIRRGQATVAVGLIDTEYSTVFVDGVIDLVNGTLRLRATPQAKGIVQLSMAVPVRITGSLASPDYTAETGSVLLKIGELVAKLTPAYAAYAFSADALREVARGNPCVAMLASAGAAKTGGGVSSAVEGASSVVEGAGSAVGNAVKGAGGILEKGLKGIGGVFQPRDSGQSGQPAAGGAE
jgi:hypothetical protein